jgi:biotin operon repressor
VDSDVAVIDDAKKAQAVLPPLRQRILAAAAQPCSSTAIAAALGLPRQRVNYHVRQLASAGFLRRAGRRKRRGLVEQRWVAAARSVVIAPQLDAALVVDHRTVAPDLGATYLLALAATVQRELAIGLARRRPPARAKRAPARALDDDAPASASARVRDDAQASASARARDDEASAGASAHFRDDEAATRSTAGDRDDVTSTRSTARDRTSRRSSVGDRDVASRRDDALRTGDACRDDGAADAVLPVLAFDAELGFASAAQRGRFAAAVRRAIEQAIAEHTTASAEGPKYRLAFGVYPIPQEPRS